MTNSIPDQFHWYDFDSYPANAAPAGPFTPRL